VHTSILISYWYKIFLSWMHRGKLVIFIKQPDCHHRLVWKRFFIGSAKIPLEACSSCDFFTMQSETLDSLTTLWMLQLCGVTVRCFDLFINSLQLTHSTLSDTSSTSDCGIFNNLEILFAAFWHGLNLPDFPYQTLSFTHQVSVENILSTWYWYLS